MKRTFIISICFTLLLSLHITAYSSEGMYYNNETGETVSVSGEDLVGKPAEAILKYLDEHSSDAINNKKSLEESINDLLSSGILKGYPDGEIHTEYNVTRAEMAAFICRILYGNNLIPDTNEFSDLTQNHWAFTELCMLTNKDLAFPIIQGYEDDTIRPDNYVTYKEAATMILRMLNYGVLIEENGGYAEGVEFWADDLCLFDRTNGKNQLNSFATRGDIIIMLSTALDSPVADTLDENCIRTSNLQKGPLTMRQYRDINNIK